MVLSSQMVLLAETALLEPAVPSRRNGMGWRADCPGSAGIIVLGITVWPAGITWPDGTG